MKIRRINSKTVSDISGGKRLFIPILHREYIFQKAAGI
ncbi:hypothetical protein DSBG_1314 [Desulfosporosinus sp. BG]|nr:hypothetical protein DSBG_1314 [Desulfosporosinus sp. BG]